MDFLSILTRLFVVATVVVGASWQTLSAAHAHTGCCYASTPDCGEPPSLELSPAISHHLAQDGGQAQDADQESESDCPIATAAAGCCVAVILPAASATSPNPQEAVLSAAPTTIGSGVAPPGIEEPPRVAA